MSPSDVCLLKIKEETDIPWRFEVPSADTCFHKLKKVSAEGERRLVVDQRTGAPSLPRDVSISYQGKEESEIEKTALGPSVTTSP